MPTKKKLIALSAPVTITAEAADGADVATTPSFSVVAYNGGPLELAYWDMPVVIDLAGLSFSRNVVANLDHDSTRRVGHVTDKSKSDGKVTLSGVFSAATAYRDEVVGSARGGFTWEASIEVNPTKVVEIEAGKTVTVNGQDMTGPLYVTRKGTLTGFAFVSHGADRDTVVDIAAQAAFSKEIAMDPKIKAWAESMGIDVDNITADQLAVIEANYAGQHGQKPTEKKSDNPFEQRKVEAKRRTDIRDIADKFIERRCGDLEYIEAIEKLHDHAIEAKMSAQEFRTELYESMVPISVTVPSSRHRDRSLTDRMLVAAICDSGKLSTLEKEFTDQELQTAHDRFPRGISLNELLITAAQANGYKGPFTTQITKDIHNYAYGLGGGRIQASGFSTIDIANVVAATANKFLHEGWMMVDQTPLRIASIRPVRNFQQITTVSLTGHLQFDKVGGDGELKHGTLGDLTYTNQADTYGAMLAITRRDMINDDLGALTAVPRRLGRGGALKLNDIFWTEFLGLVGAAFFDAGKNNLNAGVATMTTGGLAATETIFMNQTDPDGKPLGAMPAIILVPTALKSAAYTLMSSERLIDGTATATQGDANIWRGRFRVESSPYISNSSYTGYTSVGWWMLADPGEIPVIEIVALNGRVEPVVETAEASFNVLGTQMRGYSDIGVADQEYRGGVYADGGAS